MNTWTAADLPDLRGRTVVVTGATSGLGAAAARALAGRGAHVVAACRDRARAAALADETPGNVEPRHLDLADLDSVRAFADALDDLGGIDVLVNNAGVLAVPYGVTRQGFELHVGVNHLGPFLLTGLLLDRVHDRVVTITSGLHRLELRGDVVRPDPRHYQRWAAYARSKLANLLCAYELDRRLLAAGSTTVSLAAHPGVAATEGMRRDTSLQGKLVAGGRAQPVAMGVLPVLYAATQDVPRGSCTGPDGFGQRNGYPTLVRTSRRSYDRELAERTWDESERLVGFSYADALRRSASVPGARAD